MHPREIQLLRYAYLEQKPLESTAGRKSWMAILINTDWIQTSVRMRNLGGNSHLREVPHSCELSIPEVPPGSHGEDQRMLLSQPRLGEGKSCNLKTHSDSVPWQKPRPQREGIHQTANLKLNPSSGRNPAPIPCFPSSLGNKRGRRKMGDKKLYCWRKNRSNCASFSSETQTH